MDGDLNPYESPATAGEPISPDTDGKEETRRFRVALMWGSSGCGYLAVPWWMGLVPESAYWQPIIMSAILAALVCGIIAVIAAFLVALLGTVLDIIGALCGAFFGAGFSLYFGGGLLYVALTEGL